MLAAEDGRSQEEAMMRVDVDFNERDRSGHVVARIPDGRLSRLTVGQKVYLYDPPERLRADAVVARINPGASLAAFAVDWHSFVDAEFAAEALEWAELTMPAALETWPES